MVEGKVAVNVVVAVHVRAEVAGGDGDAADGVAGAGVGVVGVQEEVLCRGAEVGDDESCRVRDCAAEADDGLEALRRVDAESWGRAFQRRRRQLGERLRGALQAVALDRG